jgi:hypothetical protein
MRRAGAFLDKMTGLWRYEFGLPHQVGDSLWWGTHMWEQVEHLLIALICAQRLSENKQTAYLRLLADPGKHLQTLAEMIPAAKLGVNVPVDFEVAGLGHGQRTVDWVIGPCAGRTVLCDVKRRTIDILAQFAQMDGETTATGTSTEPNHDPALLFRSVETKFVANDPAHQLQGAWIVTDIQQNGLLLPDAFAALDASKVHFAVLGDWESDIHVLARRPEDKLFLLELFGATESMRFTFTPQQT